MLALQTALSITRNRDHCPLIRQMSKRGAVEISRPVTASRPSPTQPRSYYEFANYDGITTITDTIPSAVAEPSSLALLSTGNLGCVARICRHFI